MMLTAQAELKGHKLPDENFLDAPGKLELNQKLPASTVAYFEVSTKTSLEGKELRKKLFKFAGSFDEKGSEDAEKGMEEMKDKLGFDLDTVFDAIGDEAIIGVTATDKLTMESVMKKDKDALKEVGFVFIAHLRDKEKGEKILKSLKDVAEDKGKEAVEVTKDDDGYLFEPKDAVKEMGIPSVQASIKDDKYLVVAVGSKKRIEEIEAAYGGESTLKDDKAHAKAMKAFDQKPQAVIWVDAGRIAATALKDDDIKEAAKKGLKESGIKLETFTFEGDDRMTMALSFSYSVSKDGVWSVETEGLNAFALSAAGLYAFAARRPVPEDVQPSDGGGGGGGDAPVIGVKECDDYIKEWQNCYKDPSMKAAAQPGLDAMVKAWKDAAAQGPAARSALASGCKTALDNFPRSACR
jgi:hypothetical protein